jgi:hypothetical protein
LLQVTDQTRQLKELSADHVIAATGYRFNTQSLPFLSDEMKTELRSEQQSPILSPNFESSITGVYFTGLSSAISFGPVMRFLAGSSYTARRISYHIARDQHLRRLPLARPERCSETFSTA